MKFHLHHALIGLALVFGASASANARLGGIERDCSTGVPLPEVWPANQMPSWTYAYTLDSSSREWLAPGYPLACTFNGATPGLTCMLEAFNTYANATLPGQGTPVSSFTTSFAPNQRVLIPNAFTSNNTSRIWTAGPNNTRIHLRDNVNMVTLLEPDGTFPSLATLGVTLVSLNAQGQIVESDIALPTLPRGVGYLGTFRQIAVTRSRISFVDERPNGDRFTTDSMLFGPTGPGGHPVYAYASLKGVLTHEIGHFVGIEHSLLDSSSGPTSSLFPTMFWRAQVARFVGPTLSTAPPSSASNCTLFNYPVGYDVTQIFGLVGQSAETLEYDDLHALADGYPRPSGDAIWAQTGRIQGSVGGAVLGVTSSVVAFKSDAPDVVRFADLTDDNGAFELRLLPPGTYYVMIEPVDAQYFGRDFGAWPTFVDPFGCARPVGWHAPEFFDSAESASEQSGSFATSVTVTAGQPTLVNFVRETVAPGGILSAARVFLGPTIFTESSSRGLSMPGRVLPGAMPEEALLEVSGVPDGTAVFFFTSTDRTSTPFAGQLIQVQPNLLAQTVAGQGGWYSVPTPPNTARLLVPLPGSTWRTNWFVQAFYVHPTDGPRLTNCVNLWQASQL